MIQVLKNKEKRNSYLYHKWRLLGTLVGHLIYSEVLKCKVYFLMKQLNVFRTDRDLAKA